MDNPKKVLIFIVSYNAEKFIENVLDRIPASIWGGDTYQTEVLIIDDSSKDRTFEKSEQYRVSRSKGKLTVLYNPNNQGYGGNQKIGLHYAVREGFDAVVLLHGDGQYPPEMIGDMIAPILSGDSDLVLGSRMLNKRDALKGKMPLYKWLGNQLTTQLQNLLLGSHLSEFHTGFRAYRVAALASLPFHYNADYFDFDTDIIIQFLQTGKKIREIPIPTHYGEEICRVNGIKYCALVVLSSLTARAQHWGIWYHPKFDFKKNNEHYQPKFGYPSSHQFGLERVRPGEIVADLGCGPGYLSVALTLLGAKTIAIDRTLNADAVKNSFRAIEADLEDFDFNFGETGVDSILILDVLEHLRSPEVFLTRLRERLSRQNPRIVITTGNVAFGITRFVLLFGQFNYGKRGILDMDHCRLFTFGSLRRLLEMHGFQVLEETGIPAPFPLIFGNGWAGRLLLSLNRIAIRVFRSLFSYQIGMVARIRPTPDHLLEEAFRGREEQKNLLAPNVSPAPKGSGDQDL